MKKEAALRCCRICHFIYINGRPYTDYPELVAINVKSNIYIRDTNHSTEFPSQFLEHFAEIVRQVVKDELDKVMPQTGFRRPVKIIADKDTTKHRTRQVVCILSVFPNANELIQNIYIDQPIIKHHKAQDTAENIHSAIKPFIKHEQVEGGSYNGPYHHAKEDVPLLLNRIIGIPDEDTHSDHDYLHRCGIYLKKKSRKYYRNFQKCQKSFSIY